jgi:hypothetical protein
MEIRRSLCPCKGRSLVGEWFIRKVILDLRLKDE